MTLLQKKSIHNYNQRKSDKDNYPWLMWICFIISVILLYTSFMAGYNEAYLKRLLKQQQNNEKQKGEKQRDNLSPKKQSAFA